MVEHYWKIFVFVMIIQCISSTATIVQDREFWYEEARSALRRRLQNVQPSRQQAKNVILVVGDGMGMPTITASRILRGQRNGKTGEEALLEWDKFPAVALARTYNLDAQVGESSACATALMCGVKANYETVGLDARGKFENCFSSFSSSVPSILTWAQHEGKATGIVTTTRITHATPAPLYAHSPSRYWEDDAKMPPKARKTCKDIARQLIEDDPGRNINVLLGGGRRHWVPKVIHDPEQENDEGRRLDGRNLIEDWLRDKKRRGVQGEYVWNKQQLSKINAKRTDQLLGLFAYSHMDFEADRDKGPMGDPSLAEMTTTALSILMKNPRGFFLLLEGGRIDHGHHYNNAYRALDETLALEAALQAAMRIVELSETLIVLTADHSHVLSFGGVAPPRGNPILGVDNKVSDVDGQPYSMLLYGNGPGYSTPRLVPGNLSFSATGEWNNVHSAAVPRQWATHGGEDVPVYAMGPLAEVLFTGTFDQSYIPHAIAYIACLGDHKDRCVTGEDNYTSPEVRTSCWSPEVSSASAPGSAVIVASSVMSDDSSLNHKHSSAFCVLPTLISYALAIVCAFAIT